MELFVERAVPPSLHVQAVGAVVATAARRDRDLPTGSLRVRVYAGVGALTGKRNYLVETVPAGPNAATEA